MRKKRGFEKLINVWLGERNNVVRLPRGRKPKREKREPTEVVSIRLPKSLLKKIDVYVEKTEWKERRYAIRYLLDFGLYTLEQLKKKEFWETLVENWEEIHKIVSEKEPNNER